MYSGEVPDVLERGTENVGGGIDGLGGEDEFLVVVELDFFVIDHLLYDFDEYVTVEACIVNIGGGEGTKLKLTQERGAYGFVFVIAWLFILANIASSALLCILFAEVT